MSEQDKSEKNTMGGEKSDEEDNTEIAKRLKNAKITVPSPKQINDLLHSLAYHEENDGKLSFMQL